MQFRTVVDPGQSKVKITYNDPVLFVGSCFAESVGARMREGKMPVMINPYGTVFNPVSVLTTLDGIINCKTYSLSDLESANGLWFSYDHYTEFSSDDAGKLVERLNARLTEAAQFMSRASFLFITFGTALVYELAASGRIVSNCHKMPSAWFRSRMLSVEEITVMWNSFLDRLADSHPHLKVIFTVSPVRHLKDGAHANQVSKATLLLAVENLIKHRCAPSYFPAYELLLDDLRDYRFYDNDMIHPSSSAVDYIWEQFSDSWLDKGTRQAWKEVFKITIARNHRFISNSEAGKRRFSEQMLKQLLLISNKYPGIDFSDEVEYFGNLNK